MKILFSLTTSLTASALGAWILFGPASAATWGGIGAVIGYALRHSHTNVFFIKLQTKNKKRISYRFNFNTIYKKRFGLEMLKISLFLIFFYMTIFLIAEVTAIAYLLNYISNIPLWITSAITLIICLLYILRGGFKLSIITDKYQFIFIVLIILLSIFDFRIILTYLSFELIKKNSPLLIDKLFT